MTHWATKMDEREARGATPKAIDTSRLRGRRIQVDIEGVNFRSEVSLADAQTLVRLANEVRIAYDVHVMWVFVTVNFN